MGHGAGVAGRVQPSVHRQVFTVAGHCALRQDRRHSGNSSGSKSRASLPLSNSSICSAIWAPLCFQYGHQTNYSGWHNYNPSVSQTQSSSAAPAGYSTRAQGAAYLSDPSTLNWCASCPSSVQARSHVAMPTRQWGQVQTPQATHSQGPAASTHICQSPSSHGAFRRMLDSAHQQQHRHHRAPSTQGMHLHLRCLPRPWRLLEIAQHQQHRHHRASSTQGMHLHLRRRPRPWLRLHRRSSHRHNSSKRLQRCQPCRSLRL